MADPRPAFSPGTAAMTASVEGTSAAPMPSPMSSRAAPTSQYDVCGPTREREANSSAPPPRAAATVRVVPIRGTRRWVIGLAIPKPIAIGRNRRPAWRSEEHTSELQSRGHLVCRLLLEKKKKNEIHEEKVKEKHDATVVK